MDSKRNDGRDAQSIRFTCVHRRRAQSVNEKPFMCEMRVIRPGTESILVHFFFLARYIDALCAAIDR